MTDHDTPDPRPETLPLRERLYHSAVTSSDFGNIDIATAVAETLIAEIEQRAAARGYTDLVGGVFRTESIADFIAELRGEISNG